MLDLRLPEFTQHVYQRGMGIPLTSFSGGDMMKWPDQAWATTGLASKAFLWQIGGLVVSYR